MLGTTTPRTGNAKSCDITVEPSALKFKNNGEDSRNSPKNSSRTL